MKKVFILSLLVCIWSPLTFAEKDPEYSGSYTDVGAIKQIKVNTEVVEVEATVMGKDEDCGDNTKFILDISSDNHRDIYTTIIAAKAAEQLVHFRLDWCVDYESIGEDDYPYISQVFVH